MVAAAFGDRGDGDVQAAQEVRERGGLLFVRAVTVSCCAGRRRDPRVGAADAAVRGGRAVGGQQSANIQLPCLGHVPGLDPLCRSVPGGPGRRARLPCEEGWPAPGVTAIPWLGCGELPVLGSGSR